MRFAITMVVIAVLVLIACSAYASSPLAPVYLTNRALGGGALNQYTQGVADGVGLNNIGLLIRTYGKVTYIDTANQCFYIDDGSGCVSGATRPDNSPVIGVRVSYGGLATGVTINPPTATYVAVTGVISTAMVGTLVRPNVRPRHPDDIVPL